MAQPNDDPKMRLTRFLSERLGGHPHVNSDYPTDQTVKYVMYMQMMAEAGCTYYQRKLDAFSEVMWSFQRKSREEAVTGTTQTTSPQNAILVGAQPSEGNPVKKRD